MALATADVALGELDGIGAGGARRAIHEARKAIKRLRTIVRLLEDELGAKRFAREDDALRTAARGLSGSRDAEVLLDTLDDLVRRDPRRLRGGDIARIRSRLAGQRDDAERRMLAEPSGLTRAISELRAFRARAADWKLAPRPGIASAEPGLRRLYRQGRRRRRRAAAAGKRKRTRAMHRWRKRVKDLRYAAEMLDRVEPSPRVPTDGLGGRRAPKRSRPLERIAKRADQLGETLGEDHDLAVLSDWIRVEGKRRGIRRRTRRRLLEAIARRRRILQTRALRRGRRLYGDPPGKFVNRVRRASERDARRLS
jgi:CHAD domain-containing protein